MSTMTARIIHGDCLTELAALPEASVDAIVTDPPYGLGFMGKEWDTPGSFVERKAAKRNTFDHVGGNHNPSNSADAARTRRREAQRFGEWCELWTVEALRVLKPGGHLLAFGGTRTWHRLAVAVEDAGFELRDSIAWLYGSGFPKSLNVSKAIESGTGRPEDIRRLSMGDAYAPSGRGRVNYDNGGGSRMNGAVGEVTLSPEASAWSGWGTALKPAFEPIIVARKPLAGTVAANVLEHGTGALNIDGCRIGSETIVAHGGGATGPSRIYNGDARRGQGIPPQEAGSNPRVGRWPANVVLDEDQAAALDESRFFYVAKAPKKERPIVDGVAHPTVKPLALMRWLVRLVTPPGGTVLDPFAGSGTTVEAAILEGFDVIGIEREADYLPLIEARIARQAPASSNL